jgi:hypothetical protein
VPNGQRYVGIVPGRVVGISRSAGFVDVLAGDQAIRLHEVQLEGGDQVPAADVISSTKDTLGLRLADLQVQIEDLAQRLAEAQNRAANTDE